MNELKIELFNAITGEKEREEVSHNYIPPGVSKAMRDVARKFTINNRNLLNNNFTQNSVTALTSLFNYIVLTNNSEAINESKEMFYNDPHIGYASRLNVYGGLDTKTGTININESNGSDYQQKFVFDFSTDRSNGTFQNLYFVKDPSSVIMMEDNPYHATASVNVYDEVMGNDSSGHVNFGLDTDGEFFYRIHNTHIFKYDANLVLISFTPLSLPLQTNTLSIQPFCIDNGFIYVWSKVSPDSFYTLFKFALDGTFISKAVNIYGNTQMYVVGVYNNHVRVSYNGASIQGYHKDTLVWTSTLPAEENLPNTESLMRVVGGKCYYNNLVYDRINNVFKYGATNCYYAMCKKGADFYKLVDVGHATNPEYQNDVINHSKIFTKFFPEKFSNIGSRVKLASPVTKTNQQTMKITYTINIS